MIAWLTAWHARWIASARGVLGTVVLVAASLALATLVALHDLASEPVAASAVVWIVATLAGLTAGARLIRAEHEEGGLGGVLAAPVDWRDVFLSRAIVLAGLVVVMAGFAWAATAALFPGLGGLRDPRVAFALVGGAVGLGPLGAFTGWVALASESGEALGAALGVPLAAPLIVTGVHATERVVAEGAAWTPSLTFVVGYALSVGALCYVLSGAVAEVPA